MSTQSPADYIAKTRAAAEFGLSLSRIEAAITSGELRARYTGLKAVKVHRADCEKLLTTPPPKLAPAIHQQAA